MNNSELKDILGRAGESAPYRNYLHVRERILKMMHNNISKAANTSDYWKEELEGFDYMFDASPLIVQKLREHSHHITGQLVHHYRTHSVDKMDIFAKKLEMLRRQDNNNLFVAESPIMGGFGYPINGSLVNLDTLKFYESLIALNKAGYLSDFQDNRKIVLEIGAGWGGFAYQFKTLFPNTTYIIMDLPQTMLFSATYLMTAFPSSSTFIYNDDRAAHIITDNLKSYDFVFLPHYIINKLEIENVDLGINMVSFQEMTTEQVDEYAKKLRDMNCHKFYSMNRDRSPQNKQLTSLSNVLEKYYELTQLKVLDMTYEELPTSLSSGFTGNIINYIKTYLRRLTEKPEFRYKHIAGTLKN